MTSVLRKSSAMTAHEKPTVGDSKISFVSIDHLGWLRCDGRRLPIEGDYGLLYKVIGTTFGGDDTHFNLPDASGVVPGISSPAYPTGTLVGEYFHTLTIQEMPVHNHDASGTDLSGNPINDPSLAGNTTLDGQHTHTYQDATFMEAGGSGTNNKIGSNDTDNDNGLWWRGSDGNLYNTAQNINTSTSDPITHTHQIASNGLGLPHNNMQPTLFIGNLFIYCGDPTAGAWPYFQGTNIY